MRNVFLTVFERVCILNEDEIQITSSSRHQEIAKILNCITQVQKVTCSTEIRQMPGSLKLCSIKQTGAIYNSFFVDMLKLGVE